MAETIDYSTVKNSSVVEPKLFSPVCPENCRLIYGFFALFTFLINSGTESGTHSGSCGSGSSSTSLRNRNDKYPYIYSEIRSCKNEIPVPYCRETD
jgi:hypothetical protein